ncbi:MAG: hypothetical protein RRX93_05630 [Bacteroidales bacterium]
MKPYKTFLFLISVLAVVSLSAFLLRNYGLASAFSPENEKDLFNRLQKENIRQQDSLTRLVNHLYNLDTTLFFYETLQETPYSYFEYDTNLERTPLYPFYYQLLSLKDTGNFLKTTQEVEVLSDYAEYTTSSLYSNKFIRILHYGDSQIENDHITSTIRSFLQTAFGGNGKGMLPLFQTYYTGPVHIRKFGDWQIKTLKKNSRKGNYGLCNSYLYPPPITALIESKTKTYGNIQIKLENSFIEKNNRPLFLQALVHEEVSKQDMELRVNKTKVLSTQQCLSSFGLKRYDWALPSTTEELSLRMCFLKNRNIYALSINDTTGICVDNLPVRGSAGEIFLQNNRRFLIDNYALMNVGLVIYQFGVNAIPQDPSKIMPNYDYYERLLYQELIYLRILMPNTPIIVVGISDRSRKKGLSFETNPNVLEVRKAQKQAALKAGCVYWDLFSTMGGNNSMQKWVDRTPSLAMKDYIHFNDKGSELVGKMFYKSLINDYRKFLITEKKKKLADVSATFTK